MAEQGGAVGLSGPRPSSTGTQSTMWSSAGSNASVKPVPMKLFASWEVDKSTPSCIPRWFGNLLFMQTPNVVISRNLCCSALSSLARVHCVCNVSAFILRRN